MRRGSSWRQARIVLANELRGLLRDRKALWMGFALPVALYPLLFLGSARLGRSSAERVEALEVRVALELGAAPAELRAALRGHAPRAQEPVADGSGADGPAAGGQGPSEDRAHGDPTPEPTELVPVEPDPALRAGDEDALRELLARGFDAAVVAAPAPPDAPATHTGVQLRIGGDFASDEGAEALRRVRAWLGEAEEALAREILVATFGSDPAAGLEPELVDVAEDEDRAGLALGRLLPLIAVVVLVSGGSFAALDAFAGERERGTLETLLVQPVPAAAVAWGKFAAVLLASLTALLGNTLSLVLCVAFELGPLPGLEGGGATLLPGPGRLAAGLALLLPSAVLVAALLSLVCARARSYREGQHALMPLTFASLVPGAMAAAPTLELDWITAPLPVAGPALALRDALRGGVEARSLLVAVLSSVAWAALALRGLAGTLDAERLLGGSDEPGERAARHVQSRAALRAGLLAILLVYVVGGRMQAADPLWGLLATLWVLVPALALFSARGTARRSGESLGRVLGLVRASPAHVAGALALAPAMAFVTRHLITWQGRILPLPGELAEASPAELFGTSSPWLLFAIVALSPALTEELLFRGALLSGLRRDLRPAKVIAWQALLFAGVHLSLHRLLPTAGMGAVLAAVTLRARSLWPAVALHAGYNGLFLATALAPEGDLAVLTSPWLVLSPVVGLGLLARRR